ncbi:MAG: TMEM165/GDT1 family protein [Candidatus Omnitrophica bacterium]|nr:TMEM165/GDT1 family protein [Candidatus Omnitrophota bacterium]
MDWKVFGATFLTIFLAELGDKTQVANLCLVTKTKAWFSVLTASICAFTIVTIMTVILGKVLCKFIHPEHIKYGAGSLFIVLGFLMLLGKL